MVQKNGRVALSKQVRRAAKAPMVNTQAQMITHININRNKSNHRNKMQASLCPPCDQTTRSTATQIKHINTQLHIS